MGLPDSLLDRPDRSAGIHGGSGGGRWSLVRGRVRCRGRGRVGVRARVRVRLGLGLGVGARGWSYGSGAGGACGAMEAAGWAALVPLVAAAAVAAA